MTQVIALADSGRVFTPAIFMAVPSLEDLRSRQQELQASSEQIVGAADDANRDMTEDELGQIEGNASEVERIGRQIAARERVNLAGAGTGRRTTAEPAAAATTAAGSGTRTVPATARAADAGRWGFNNLGDFAVSVRAAVLGNGVDQRLQNAATTYSSEGVGADGGFAVPPDMRTDIMSKIFAEDSLVQRTDRIPTSSNTLVLPIDMTTPWQSTGGIQAYWTGEAQTKTQSKVALEPLTMRTNTLAALVPVTEELLEDAPAMDSYLRRKVPEKMDFKLSYGIAWGGGVGMPLGWMNSPALVTVAAESAQTAATVNVTNVLKMMGRMPTPSRQTAVWLIHPDAEVQLPLMTVGQQPVYMPPGGVADAPLGRLFGRPVIPHQICKTLGTLGDIMFVDLNQYLSVLKTGGARDQNGMRSDVSIHLWFDQDMVAYRFTIRMAGQPWWSAATAMLSGSNTMSPFVTLAAR